MADLTTMTVADLLAALSAAPSNGARAEEEPETATQPQPEAPARKADTRGQRKATRSPKAPTPARTATRGDDPKVALIEQLVEGATPVHTKKYPRDGYESTKYEIKVRTADGHEHLAFVYLRTPLTKAA